VAVAAVEHLAVETKERAAVELVGIENLFPTLLQVVYLFLLKPILLQSEQVEQFLVL
tara:strand:- start:418 stop:588 length:171 start_codon:yes stop_codon:yes gene_type:complete